MVPDFKYNNLKNEYSRTLHNILQECHFSKVVDRIESKGFHQISNKPSFLSGQMFCFFRNLLVRDVISHHLWE